jgi:hypothetical protein
MSLIYRNRFILNQRGGSIDIDNTTEREKIKISHRSGSNINMTNIATSELATNNKQTYTINDEFSTVGGSKSEFIFKDTVLRTGETSFSLKGFIKDDEFKAYEQWKEIYKNMVVLVNSEFKILRGGIEAIPNGPKTSLGGERAPNPTLKNNIFTVENEFKGYQTYINEDRRKIPLRLHNRDDVVTYATVVLPDSPTPAESRRLTIKDIVDAAGEKGSKAPGVMEFPPEKSAATEEGSWNVNSEAQQIDQKLIDAQDPLNPIEEKMGMGGDTIDFIKRHKFEQVGVLFNDFPSLRIDDKGRSQPLEMVVSKKGIFTNHDYVPMVEELDNSSTFPCGNDDKIVGNRYSRNVGSGGINLKTTGTIELGGSSFKIGAAKIHINARHGVQIGSESSIELESLKSITLRTNRQVYVECSLGVRGNVAVGGGLYAEGELYCHHITAPLEVHETEDTIVASRFATDEDRKLLIGEAQIGDVFYPVYAIDREDLIISYPHSHHHHGPPMRLTKANKDVRKFAMDEGINTHNSITQSLPQVHERKYAQVASDEEDIPTV